MRTRPIMNALILVTLIVALSAISVRSAPLESPTEDEFTRTRAAHSSGETSSSSSREPAQSNGESTSRTSTSTSAPETSSTTEETPDTTTESFEFVSQKNTTTFDCNGKVTGYYADVRLKCRVYHFCTQLDGLDGPTYQRMTYLCLEGSFFDQKDLNCVREADLKVPCRRAEAEYERSNKQFDPKEESQPSMSDNFAANLMMNPITRFIAGR